MKLTKISLRMAAILMGLAVVGWASPAQAALSLTIDVTGSGSITVMDNVAPDDDMMVNQVRVLGTSIGGVIFDVESGQTNSPGAGGVASSFFDSAAIRNTTGVAQTFTITVVADGFTDPTASPFQLFTSAGSTIASTPLGATLTSATFRTTVTGPGGSTDSTPIALNVASPPGAPGSISGNEIDLVPALGTPFTMTLTFTGTLSAGAVLSGASGSAVLLSAVPEPATWIAVAATLPMLGFGAWMRRRKQSA